MLVYGDVEHTVTVGAKQAAIESILSEIPFMPAGIVRHGALVTAFVATGELVQGLIDAEFHELGVDTLSPTHRNGMDCLFMLACAIDRSWRSGFKESSVQGEFLAKLFSFDPSGMIHAKQAEGYAFYALYPENYLEAARASGLGPDTQVIGIRSIGTGLGALVAAALGASAPLTLRPTGHPFRREVNVDRPLAKSLAKQAGAFAIVDEGPGLSGSSFGAVADWLEEAGVPRQRIHFFPSHEGLLGPQASPKHRERWDLAPRHVRTMDDLLFGEVGCHRLTTWVEDLVGPLDAPLEEISGGEWRRHRYQDEASWPPSILQQERRKFLARGSGKSWMVKFAGLGETGSRKLRMARRLHEAGFAPAVAGLRHGFLVQIWHEDGRSLDQITFDRDRLIGQVGAYLGFRARQYPAAGQPGASLGELRHMAVYNAQQALGDDVGAFLDRSLPPPDNLEGQVRRVWSDNRMHLWEWLVSRDRLFKADALDHGSAHDLIGHQDIAWDIAGAVVELNLSESETARLCTIVERESGYPVAPELLAFLIPCYCAFHMGASLMAAGAIGGAEEARLRGAADHYGQLLKRHESLGLGLRS
ncbi:hypothetical protein [Microvirga lotononidis]|uniref:Uncharacterized protein n=1 Tax=Microvirga lotononidis TaxID=864069 RepID=I4YLY6_9HYPH|nr:hypothetical protein [Microvirga lotononidis]EIM24978.1 hypothetical protein MicloDRAFT_00056970 [Microvirga lotononidis]WQO29527.1 hypothetical protein U0023_10830 [Microvirga lotononidis]